MSEPKLYMLLLGCKPQGRFTEQHDVFFGIAASLKELIPQINAFWPEAKNNIHIDAWREVTAVDGYAVHVSEKENKNSAHENSGIKLFFVNLGGYKENEFEEYHYRMLAAAADQSTAIQAGKKTAFYKHAGFKGAPSHVDDKYVVDADDIFEVEAVLSSALKTNYTIQLLRSEAAADEMHLGYLPLSKLMKEK